MQIRPKSHNIPNGFEENIDDFTLGELILIARNRANLSQETLGKKADVGRLSIHRYEHGLSIPTCDRLERIARAVNHPIDWFYQ